MPGLSLLILLTVSAQIIDPLSGKSSLSTDVITACLIFIIEIDFATFSGSAQSIVSGLPVFTPQNPHDLVHMFPKIMKVAVPSPQHSPIFGQLPDEHIVFNLYLSTNDLRLEYFFPVGSFTLIQLGFFLNFTAFSLLISKTVFVMFEFPDFKT